MSSLLEDCGTLSFYRSSDSISNFKIKVRLERQDVDLSEIVFPSKSKKLDRSGKVEERVFAWQEKVFSPREIKKYSAELQFETVLEQKYQQEISQLKSISSDSLKPHRLFTYVDHDHFNKSSEKLHVEGNSLAQKTNENASVTMFIMADLTSTDKEPSEEDEMILCTIKYSNNKILSIKPDFNWKDKPYTILSVGREVYHYSLIHASKQLTREELEKEFKMYKDIYSKHNDILQGCIGCEFELPISNHCRVFINGEIISAKGFEYNHLFISWFVDLPEGWTKNNFQSLFGVTQTCSTNKEGIAYFSSPFSLDLVYNCKQSSEVLNWPRIFIEIMSVDVWSRYRSEGYGYLTLPCSSGLSINHIACWRPKTNGILSELRRFFIGNCTELEDISYVAVPSNFKNGHLSKFSFKTVSTGKVIVKTQTIVQSMDFPKRLKTSEVPFIANKKSEYVFGSVASVVDSIQKAKQRLRTVRENLVKEYLNEPSSST